MAFAFTLDSTVPAEGGLVSAGASNIRNLTAALIERLNSFFVDANTSPLTGKSGASMAATTFTGTITVTSGSVAVAAGAADAFSTTVTGGFLSSSFKQLTASTDFTSRWIFQNNIFWDMRGIASDGSLNFIYNGGGTANLKLLNTGGVTIPQGLTISANGANITGGVSIVNGGLAVSAGDSTFAAGIKQTGTVVTRIENSFATRPTGSAGVGVEFGVSGASALIQAWNMAPSFAPLSIAASLTSFTQGGIVTPSIKTVAVTSGVVFATATFVTLFAPTVKGLYLVTVINDTNGAMGPNGVGLILVDGANNIQVITQFLGFANNGFRGNGGNIQYNQQSVASATMSWTYQFIG